VQGRCEDWISLARNVKSQFWQELRSDLWPLTLGAHRQQSKLTPTQARWIMSTVRKGCSSLHSLDACFWVAQFPRHQSKRVLARTLFTSGQLTLGKLI
jgi:hypothetical protein